MAKKPEIRSPKRRSRDAPISSLGIDKRLRELGKLEGLSFSERLRVARKQSEAQRKLRKNLRQKIDESIRGRTSPAAQMHSLENDDEAFQWALVQTLPPSRLQVPVRKLTMADLEIASASEEQFVRDSLARMTPPRRRNPK